jgi:hypothetical protein
MKHFLVCSCLCAALASILLATAGAQTPDATGTGTTNYITRWLTATSQGNSLIYQNPTSNRIGIGTTNPAVTFDVANGNLMARGVGGFKTAGQTAFLYLGDLAHSVRAIRSPGSGGGGTSLSAYQASNMLFLQDFTGNVGIGTTSPGYELDVHGRLHANYLVMPDHSSGGCVYIYVSGGAFVIAPPTTC